MTAREVLTQLFDEETAYDDPAQAADLMLSRLAAAGLVVVPRDPTDAMAFAGAKSLANEMQAPGATLMAVGYTAMIDAALKDST